jgi:glycosyltransferase involved in cell wall biosynthesis
MESKYHPFQFSIIVPIYNIEKYLCGCIDSILFQSFALFECILVDDGSPDNCPVICDKYASDDTRIKVLHQKNAGLSCARNAGIRASSGKYLIFLDGDDFFSDANVLNNLYHSIKKSNMNVYFNSYLTTFTDGYNEYSSFDGFKSSNCCNSLQFLKKNKNPLLPAFLFVIERNFLFRHNLFFKENIFHEDLHWIPRVICSVDKIIINHNPFYTYRKSRIGSITSSLNPKRESDKLLIINDLLLLSKNESILYKSKFYKDCCYHLWHSIFGNISFYKNDRVEEYNKIVDGLKKLSFLLLRPNIKSCILFLFILFFGVSNTNQLRFYYKRIKKCFYYCSNK